MTVTELKRKYNKQELAERLAEKNGTALIKVIEFLRGSVHLLKVRKLTAGRRRPVSTFGG